MNSVAESDLIIREPSIDELHDVEAMQIEVWGVPDIEVVNLHHLIAVQASGGILLCAFEDKTMAGFVYGFVGLERSRTVHHSHMLAVRKEYRSHNLGYRLKLEQRRRVLDQGIGIMTWTFDPLQSLNAFFNFGKLGVIADRYFPDFYGTEAASFLHQNGTDRLWVSWHLEDQRVNERLGGKRSSEDVADLPALVSACEMDAPMVMNPSPALSSDRFTIEIPADIGAIERSDPAVARNWRQATRDAFRTALDAGFVVEDLVMIDRGDQRVGAYVLSTRKDLKLW
jgi:predicted GNAT superfamily acetyltransferase